MTISDNLKREMRKQKVSQSQLALWLGVTRSAVSTWCTGKNVPRLPMLIRIAELLKCTVGDLLE